MFVYFVCNINLHFFIDYIKSLQYNYKNVKLITNNQEIPIDHTSKYIFIQKVPNIPFFILNQIKCYLLNTEQLSKLEWVQYLSQINMNIIDYSLANIKCLAPYKEHIYYLPYMVNKDEIFNYKKIYDIAAIGLWTDSYRLNITNQLSNVNIIEGFDNARDDMLFKHKILLNVHFNEKFKIFEQIRCNRCIFNKMIVITEKSLDNNYELKDYIIECDYDNLVSVTNDVLNNYEYYYNKIFKDFDIKKIEKMYKNNSDAFFMQKLI